ncbi:magnesium/cobalt transporter CorA [bacterium]|nr:magnesium/cobalt transporter CorA [bacterium]
MVTRRSAHHQRMRRKRRHPLGTPPGTLTVSPEAHPTSVHVMGYGPAEWMERQLTREELQELPALARSWPVVWADVEGLADLEAVQKLGAVLGLHPLALEDVLNVPQRAKVEAYDGTLFLVAQLPSFSGNLRQEQISIFLTDGIVVTFQERPGDTLALLHERIRKRGGRVRDRGADYLAYAVLDLVVDSYFPVLEGMVERMEALEDAILTAPRRDLVADIHNVKHDVRVLRRAIWPLRDALNALLRDSFPHLTPDTRIYLRDCYDHVVLAMELLENLSELCADLLDMYMSSVSYRMNEVMKVLTIIATIFMPLSVIAGIYGMNFNTEVSPWNMPELNWAWGYPFALGMMALVAGGLLYYFWRKGWLWS